MDDLIDFPVVLDNKHWDHDRAERCGSSYTCAVAEAIEGVLKEGCLVSVSRTIYICRLNRTYGIKAGKAVIDAYTAFDDGKDIPLPITLRIPLPREAILPCLLAKHLMEQSNDHHDHRDDRGPK